ERIGLAVGRNLPALSQVRDDRLSVPGVTPDQGIIHRALRGHVGDGARLMHVEVRRGTQDAVSQSPAGFGMRLWSFELEGGRLALAGELLTAGESRHHGEASARDSERLQESASVHSISQLVQLILMLRRPFVSAPGISGPSACCPTMEQP